MECLADGLLYKEIEDKLWLSRSLLKKIQHKLFAKLGATNRTEAIKRWQEGPRNGTSSPL